MFEHFNEKARQVVVLAQDEARALEHDHIGTEHIMLGLVRVDASLAARLLDSPDIRVEDLRVQILDRVGRGDGPSPDQFPFTPRAKKVLELAFQESLSLGHRHVGPEHILLGLLREEKGLAARELESLGATVDEARARVVRIAQFDVTAAAPGVRRATTRIPFAPVPERVFEAAQDEARSLEHDYIGTEHILLALLRDEDGLAARVLAALGITFENVHGQVARIAGQPSERTGRLPMTARVRRALTGASRETLALHHDSIGTEHVLLSLVREGQGVAARILLDAKIDADRIRGEIIRMRPPENA